MNASVTTLNILFVILVFASCTPEDPFSSDTIDCKDGQPVEFQYIWSNTLDQFYQYDNLEWMESELFIGILVETDDYDNILFMFDKSTGELIDSKLLNYSTNSCFYTNNDQFYFTEYGKFGKYDPFLKKYEIIYEMDHGVNGAIHIVDEEHFLFCYDDFYGSKNIALYNHVSNENKVLYSEEYENEDDRSTIEDPLMYNTEDGDSLIYFKYFENRSEGELKIMRLNLLENDLEVMDSTDYFLYYQLKDGELLTYDSDRISLRNPINYDENWAHDFDNIYGRIKKVRKYGNQLICIFNKGILSLDVSTGTLNWQLDRMGSNYFNFLIDLQNYVIFDDILIAEKPDGHLGYVNLKSNQQEFYCELPAAFNNLTNFSSEGCFYAIDQSKKLKKISVQ